jgi:hypothetical protein
VSDPAVPTSLEWLKDIGLPLATFVAGFFVSRFTLTKKDRKDVEQKNFENSTKLLEEHQTAYDAYTKALDNYGSAPTPDLANFIEIATKGDRYFDIIHAMSSAILSDKVDTEGRDNHLLPKIRAVADRTLLEHYAILQTIAAKHHFPYSGELRRADYNAIFSVVEKYGHGPDWEAGG